MTNGSPYRGFKYRVVTGAGEVVAVLEEALEHAKRGELQGVVVCGITEHGCGFRGAHVDGIPYPWPRLQAAVDTAQHDLIGNGTADWA